MTAMSTCNKCEARYPSAPVGLIHKCHCEGGMMIRDDPYGKIHTDGSRSGGQLLDDSIEAKALAFVNQLAAIYTKRAFTVSEPHLSGYRILIGFDRSADADAFFHSLPILSDFIPKPKPDPLEEVLMEIDHAAMWVDKCAEEIRASLKARGWEIREKGK